MPVRFPSGSVVADTVGGDNIHEIPRGLDFETESAATIGIPRTGEARIYFDGTDMFFKNDADVDNFMGGPTGTSPLSGVLGAGDTTGANIVHFNNAAALIRFTRTNAVDIDVLAQGSAGGVAQLPDLGGSTDQFVMEDVAQTLTNKTLTTPTVGDFSNAEHNHEDADGGGQVSITAATTGTLAETRGGTNQTTYATGDVIYASGADTLAKRAVGAEGRMLAVVGGVPDWEQIVENLVTGLEVSSNTTNPTFQVDISPGMCRNDDNDGNIVVTSTLTADITVSGADGLDTGSEAASTWYFVYVIAGGANPVASLLSTSSTSPTLPGTYTDFRRVGVVRNDSSSDFITFRQIGGTNYREVIYESDVGERQVLSSGSATVATTVDCSSLVPPTSSHASIFTRQLGTPSVFFRITNGGVVIQALVGGGESDGSFRFPLTSGQAMSYQNFGSGGDVDIFISGYMEAI